MQTRARRVRIAVDAMGGDSGPEVVVRGARLALEEAAGEFDLLLVGDEPTIWGLLGVHSTGTLPLFVVHAREQVGMAEKAPRAYRGKRDSSISVCSSLVATGRADALVSAGNTGAVVATSLIDLGRMPGILRPAIATVIPTNTGQCVMLDVGANADCKPINLYQFAHMGRIYASLVLGIAEPRVGLLNIGEEPTKGSTLAQAAYHLLEDSPLPINFVGNVEGRDIFSGKADVVVCDGFTGNVILKLAGSLAELGSRIIAREVRRSPILRLGGLLMKPSLTGLKKRFNYEEYGGALLLGTKGISVVSHGRSSARAISSAIRVAVRASMQGLEDAISRVLAVEGVGSLRVNPDAS